MKTATLHFRNAAGYFRAAGDLSLPGGFHAATTDLYPPTLKALEMAMLGNAQQALYEIALELGNSHSVLARFAIGARDFYAVAEESCREPDVVNTTVNAYVGRPAAALAAYFDVVAEWSMATAACDDHDMAQQLERLALAQNSLQVSLRTVQVLQNSSALDSVDTLRETLSTELEQFQARLEDRKSSAEQENRTIYFTTPASGVKPILPRQSVRPTDIQVSLNEVPVDQRLLPLKELPEPTEPELSGLVSLYSDMVALSDAIWGVLKDWPHSLRWALYGHLDKVVSTTCTAYRVVSNRASYKTRYILKRLTADTQKHHILTMAKITHGQAIAAFTATLDSIQGHPADIVTISPVVEACRRCTDLSIDVLLYLVLGRMADSRRSRLKDDGINPAQWYATLSLFLGLCLRKLSVAQEIVEAVLFFLYSKLVEDDEPLLIIALSDMIKCVADMEVDINLSAKKIASHGGVLLDVVSGAWRKLQPDALTCGTISDFRTERERNSATFVLLKAFERTEVHSYVAVAIARLHVMPFTTRQFELCLSRLEQTL